MMTTGFWRAGVGVVAFLFVLFSLVGGGASLMAMSVSEVPNPRLHNDWVSDSLGIFPPNVRSGINERLSALERETGIEVALVTLESVDAATPKDFATELFNVWGIGKQGSNNGLLILLVRGERRLEMETGYGLEEALPDGWLKRMQTEEMVPHFKAEHYDRGLEAGVDAVLLRLRQTPEEIRAQNALGGGDSDSDEPIEIELGWLITFLFGGAGGSAFGVSYWRKRERSCPTCKTMMTMIAEEKDDAFLDSGQIAEEEAGAVDYQFYFCEDCGFERKLVVNKWFSGHSKCGSCGYKTMYTTSVVVRSATTVSSGLKRVTENCKHCPHDNVRDVILPRIETSSSGGGSGSGGGGSFGGGSSGGGGSGSSW